MLPQQWSNPDYCYLEPASKIKPEQPQQMAVPTNHNLGGRVIQLVSYLIDMKNYRGFQGYSPFQVPKGTPPPGVIPSIDRPHSQGTLVILRLEYMDSRVSAIGEAVSGKTAPAISAAAA